MFSNESIVNNNIVIQNRVLENRFTIRSLRLQTSRRNQTTSSTQVAKNMSNEHLGGIRVDVVIFKWVTWNSVRNVQGEKSSVITTGIFLFQLVYYQ